MCNVLSRFFLFQLILTAALSAYIIRRARVELNKTMEEHSSKTAHKDANMNGIIHNGFIDKFSVALENGNLPETHVYIPNGISPLASRMHYPALEVVSENKSNRWPVYSNNGKPNNFYFLSCLLVTTLL